MAVRIVRPSHTSLFGSTLSGRPLARCGRSSFGYNLSLIALIGIILLIGIVKKERHHYDRFARDADAARA